MGDKFKVNLFLGTETYQGIGPSIKVAKQNAAAEALNNTKYPTASEKKFSAYAAAASTLGSRRIGVTATSELHELATKKGVRVDFKFLEPFNFEFKHSMRMWNKKEMLGNYRVQLNVAGYEFYGQAELPQQAKHNAATQAMPIVRNLPDPAGTSAVVAAPAPSSNSQTSMYDTPGLGSGMATQRHRTKECEYGFERNCNGQSMRSRMDISFRSWTSSSKGLHVAINIRPIHNDWDGPK